MSKTVVVIDDMSIVLRPYRDTFEYLGGYEATCIFPNELDQIPSEVDIFFVDYNMKTVLGPEIITKLRISYPRSYIVGWSMDLTFEKVRHFEEAGADEAIDKGISLDRFRKFLETIKQKV